jgi:hypothetical protein
MWPWGWKSACPSVYWDASELQPEQMWPWGWKSACPSVYWDASELRPEQNPAAEFSFPPVQRGCLHARLPALLLCLCADVAWRACAAWGCTTPRRTPITMARATSSTATCPAPWGQTERWVVKAARTAVPGDSLCAALPPLLPLTPSFAAHISCPAHCCALQFAVLHCPPPPPPPTHPHPPPPTPHPHPPPPPPTPHPHPFFCCP